MSSSEDNPNTQASEMLVFAGLFAWVPAAESTTGCEGCTQSKEATHLSTWHNSSRVGMFWNETRGSRIQEDLPKMNLAVASTPHSSL